MDNSLVKRMPTTVNEFESHLLNLIISGCTAEKYIRKLSFLLCNPLVVIDKNFKIIHAAQEKKITDPYWNAHLSQGYCSYEFISELKKIESFIHSPSDEEAFIVTCQGSTIKRLISKIFIDNQLWGYLVLLEFNQSFNRLTGEYLKKASQLYGTLYVDKTAANLDIITHTYLDIIENGIKDRLALKQRIKNFPISIHFPIVAIIVDFSLYEGKNKPKSFLKQNFNSYFPSSQLFLYDNMICLIMSYEHFKAHAPLSNFKQFILEQNLYLTLSGKIKNWEKLQSEFNETLIFANHIQALQNKAGLYETATNKHLKFLLRSSRETLQSDINDAIIRLLEYDNKEQTNYLTILEYLLKNRFNKSKTAEALYIHRNTIQYYIKKIEEITEISLEDTTHDLELAHSLNVLRYLQNTNDPPSA